VIDGDGRKQNIVLNCGIMAKNVINRVRGGKLVSGRAAVRWRYGNWKRGRARIVIMADCKIWYIFAGKVSSLNLKM